MLFVLFFYILGFLNSGNHTKNVLTSIHRGIGRQTDTASRAAESRHGGTRPMGRDTQSGQTENSALLVRRIEGSRSMNMAGIP